jgi:RNA polymerase sigma factor (sigma-70 family)
LRNNTDVDPDRSFERIYRRHRRDVYGSVLRDVRDPDEAEDVTQVAFLNAFRAMRRGDQPEKPRAWLLTIARNVVRRRATIRAGRPQEVELDTEVLLSLDDEEGSASADICAALRRLTDAQREAILLREIQGKSYSEIADELTLSTPAVEALIFRARRALAEELELVDRVPVVHKRRGHGLFALPGLAKLGSFGFGFSRASVACLVGCAVVATVPIGDRAASGEPSTRQFAPAPHSVGRSVAAPKAERKAAATAPAKHTRKHNRAGTRSGHDGKSPTKQTHGQATQPSSSTLLQPPPVQLPPVQLPPVQLPPVQPPPVTVPQVTVPQVTVPQVTVTVPQVTIPPAVVQVPTLPAVPSPPPLPQVPSLTS